MAPVREVAFELEAFEWSEDRLDVVGRWKGLAGRRLARPVLTVQLDSGRRKRVVAMPGGQLGAAEESWHASFNWPGDPAEIIGAELELGRNVVVELPLPDRRRRRRRRLAAEQSVTEELRLEAGALRAQVDRLRAELAGRERELMAAREQLAAAPVTDQPTVELRRDEADAAEREELSAELAGLRAEHDAERARWQTEIDELREAFSAAAEEADQTRRRHAAELAAVRASVAQRPARAPLRRAPEPPAEEASAPPAAAALAPDTADTAPAAPDTAPVSSETVPMAPDVPSAAYAAGEPVDEDAERGPSPLQQLRERLAGMVATNGHRPPEEDEGPPALRTTRSASAARARAGATVAARRSTAEVWALRGLAAIVVLVLLLTFLLLITSLA
ncbi:MAG TPA: hypothetical protein VE526_11415 [Solirubrobacteraceae bacterium]|nr:hypothetical protein [Solirubrobacteraceae bacterium]